MQESYARSLRERDDEIVRLKEQVRRGARFNPSPTDTEAAGRRRVMEENAKLRRDVAQLQQELKTRPDSAGGSVCSGAKSEEPTVRTGTANGNSLAAAMADDSSVLQTALRIVAEVPKTTPAAAGISEERLTALIQENRQLREENRQLREDLTRCRENSVGGAASGGGPRRSPPRRTSPRSQIVQLQRQLHQQSEDSQVEADRWRSENARLMTRCERLQQQQQKAMEDDISRILEETIPMDGQDQVRCLAQHLNATRRDRDRLNDEIRQIEQDMLQQSGQAHLERQQIREEREAVLTDQRRRDHTEECLRRQVAGLQERLDTVHLDEAEREKERRQLRSAVKQLNERTVPEHDEEAEVQRRAEQLEMQVTSQNREIQRLRQEAKKLEGERNDACSRLAKRSQSTVPQRASPSQSEHGECQERQQTVSRGGRGGRGGGGSVVPSRSRATAPPRRRPFAGNCQSNGLSRCLGTSMGSSQGTLHEKAASMTGTSSGAPSGASVSSTAGDMGCNMDNDSQSAARRSHSASSYTSSSDESSMGSSSAATETRKRMYSNLCAVFGDEPLPKIAGVGWYYRLRINNTSTGWVGGFSIGVTLSTPMVLTGLPDRAARVPRSWIAGYWGRTFANGQERLTNWRPQTLRVGDEVGFLVNLEGECSVFVNDEERCRFSDPPVPVKAVPVELTALIDMSATAANVTFLNGAPPPQATVARSGARALVPNLGLSTAVNGGAFVNQAGSNAVSTMSQQPVGDSMPRPPPPSPKSRLGAVQQETLGQEASRSTGSTSPPLPHQAPVSTTAAAVAAARLRVPQLPLPIVHRNSREVVTSVPLQN